MAVTSPRDVGPSTPTCTPGPTPRACRAAAMHRASWWRRAHSTRSAGPASPAAAPTKVIVPDPSAAVWRRETTEGISRWTRARRSGLLAGSAPGVPVGDALDRRARRGLEVVARVVGDGDERDLGHA